MSEFTVGQRFTATVTLTDTSGAVVDPGTFRFDLKPPSGSGVSDSNYVYNGSSWTNSESTIGDPSKVSAGVYRLEVTLPSANTASGEWRIWWLTTENGSGDGVDSGTKTIRVRPR